MCVYPIASHVYHNCSQKAVTAHLKSKQLLPFDFVRQHSVLHAVPCDNTAISVALQLRQW